MQLCDGIRWSTSWSLQDKLGQLLVRYFVLCHHTAACVGILFPFHIFFPIQFRNAGISAQALSFKIIYYDLYCYVEYPISIDFYSQSHFLSARAWWYLVWFSNLLLILMSNPLRTNDLDINSHRMRETSLRQRYAVFIEANTNPIHSSQNPVSWKCDPFGKRIMNFVTLLRNTDINNFNNLAVINCAEEVKLYLWLINY